MEVQEWRPSHVLLGRLAVLAGVYVFIRFVLTGKLDEINPYATYVLELLLVWTTAFALRNTLSERFRIPKAVYIHTAGALLLGFILFKAAQVWELYMPFDLSSGEVIVFLLIVAPILEEAIFRFVLWEPMRGLMSSRAALIWTTLFFAYSHYHAIWFVPADYHGFVYFQTIYTLVLGAWCGYFVWRHNSLGAAILVHFGFNLGFYISSVIF